MKSCLNFNICQSSLQSFIIFLYVHILTERASFYGLPWEHFFDLLCHRNKSKGNNLSRGNGTCSRFDRGANLCVNCSWYFRIFSSRFRRVRKKKPYGLVGLLSDVMSEQGCSWPSIIVSRVTKAPQGFSLMPVRSDTSLRKNYRSGMKEGNRVESFLPVRHCCINFGEDEQQNLQIRHDDGAIFEEFQIFINAKYN